MTGATPAWDPRAACRAVHWLVAGQIVWVWVVTIEAAGEAGAVTCWTLVLLGAG